MIQSDRDIPIVTIVMPTYNAERFVEKSIESIINQTFKEWELIITDDNSKDSTLDIIEDIITSDHYGLLLNIKIDIQ